MAMAGLWQQPQRENYSIIIDATVRGMCDVIFILNSIGFLWRAVALERDGDEIPA